MTSHVLTFRDKMVPYDFGSNKTVIRYRLKVRYCWIFLSDHLQSMCPALHVRGESSERSCGLLTADGDLKWVEQKNAEMEWKNTWAARLDIFYESETLMLLLKRRKRSLKGPLGPLLNLVQLQHKSTHVSTNTGLIRPLLETLWVNINCACLTSSSLLKW